MSKKKIAWITFNAFIDTDIYIVKELKEIYDIYWFIIKSGNDEFEYVDEIQKLKENEKIKIYMLQCGPRLRSPSCIIFYRKLLNKICTRFCPDVIYTALAGAPYYIPVLARYVKKNNVIVAVHNVHVPKGGASYFFFKWYNWITIHLFQNYQTFSKDQKQLLEGIAPNKNVYYAPFILKDYGESQNIRTNNVITFLNFGNIRPYKRLDVLIDAAQRAYKITDIRFRVIIAGKCDDWSPYERLITERELFDLRLHRINNEDIPDLFNECDYFVAPYQDIAQSGSSVVAINYKKPLIASRLPSFEEYIDDNRTGFLIKPASVEDLTVIFVKILKSNNKGYEKMVELLEEKRDREFSSKAIVKMYKEFIDATIEG